MSLKFCEVLLIEVAVSLRYYFLLDELFKYKGFNRRPMANTGLTCRDFLLFTMLQLSNLCWTVTEQEGILEICQWCVLFLNQWDTINKARETVVHSQGVWPLLLQLKMRRCVCLLSLPRLQPSYNGKSRGGELISESRKSLQEILQCM